MHYKGHVDEWCKRNCNPYMVEGLQNGGYPKYVPGIPGYFVLGDWGEYKGRTSWFCPRYPRILFVLWDWEVSIGGRPGSLKVSLCVRTTSPVEDFDSLVFDCLSELTGADPFGDHALVCGGHNDQAANVQGSALAVAEHRKRVVHFDNCRSVGITFIPLAIEYLGGWSNDAMITIKKIGFHLGTRLGLPPVQFSGHLIQRLSITLWHFSAQMWLCGSTTPPSVEDSCFRDLSEFIENDVKGDGLDHISTPPLTAALSVSLSSGTPHQAKNATPKFSLKLGKKPQPTINSALTSSPEEEMNKTVEIYRMIEDELRRQGSFPITLKPFSASVDHIATVVSVEVFDGAPVVLLDKDNNQTFDSATTQNTKYWKGHKNKKAVTEGDYSILSDLRNSMLSKSKLKAGPPARSIKVDTGFEDLESKLSSMEYKILYFNNLEASKERLVAEIGQPTACVKELEAKI
uniref:Uncharacterized protein n=1 Tax=Amphimedon queenslandica TaxID=400682 RepID=A0A1X7U4S3_AMPQE